VPEAATTLSGQNEGEGPKTIAVGLLVQLETLLCCQCMRFMIAATGLVDGLLLLMVAAKVEALRMLLEEALGTGPLPEVRQRGRTATTSLGRNVGGPVSQGWVMDHCS
jgi:hypothetical protein